MLSLFLPFVVIPCMFGLKLAPWSKVISRNLAVWGGFNQFPHKEEVCTPSLLPIITFVKLLLIVDFSYSVANKFSVDWFYSAKLNKNPIYSSMTFGNNIFGTCGLWWRDHAAMSSTNRLLLLVPSLISIMSFVKSKYRSNDITPLSRIPALRPKRVDHAFPWYTQHDLLF